MRWPLRGLESGQYALFVSTIEPRKGHRMIYEAWTDLLESGVPQSARFKLVFAGREGWMVDELMHDIRNNKRLDGTLQIIGDADDAQIAALYRHAAFCLYPSRYEGYGLPLIEALSHGKAVLASTGGAIPEVVGNLCPCLDPEDPWLWQTMLRIWIETPAARAIYEDRIRALFRQPTWNEFAERFFSLVSACASVDWAK
jgi:glycosyltransferase involved in cell wall biosynthesis